VEGAKAAFALADGWGVVEELARRLIQGASLAGASSLPPRTTKSVGAVRDYASGVFEVVTAGVDHGEI